MSEENTSQEQGAATPAAPSPPSPPSVDLSPLEQRLNRISEAVTSLTRRDQDREIQSAAARLRDYEYRVQQAVQEAGTAVDTAEKALATAYDSGDPSQIATATRRLTDAVARREQANLDKREFDRAKANHERRQGGSSGSRGQHTEQPSGQQSQQKDNTALTDWKNRNSAWYGVDVDMTKAAHAIDRQIRSAGVIPVGSKEYFQAIDRQMAQQYPDKFRSTPNTSSSTPAAAGGQQPQGGRIPRDVLETWRRMGINVDDDKTLSRMVKNRENLARKGILPEQPAYGRVTS